MAIKIIKQAISKKDLAELAREIFGDMIKVVVDIEQNIMAIGGELHADEEALLLEQGSKQANLWGINLYVDKSGDDFVEFDSMINIRPSQNNRSRSVEDETIREKIKKIINTLVVD